MPPKCTAAGWETPPSSGDSVRLPTAHMSSGPLADSESTWPATGRRWLVQRSPSQWCATGSGVEEESSAHTSSGARTAASYTLKSTEVPRQPSPSQRTAPWPANSHTFPGPDASSLPAASADSATPCSARSSDGNAARSQASPSRRSNVWSEEPSSRACVARAQPSSAETAARVFRCMSRESLTWSTRQRAVS